jgi:hypothetical protein
MGACSGKLLEKEYAGYSPATRTRGSPSGRTKGSPTVRTGKQKVVVQTKKLRVENRHGFIMGIYAYHCA